MYSYCEWTGKCVCIWCSACTCAGKLAHDPPWWLKRNKQHILNHVTLSIKTRMQTSTMSQKAGGCMPVHWVLWLKSMGWAERISEVRELSLTHRAKSHSLHRPKSPLLMHMYENQQLIKQTHNIQSRTTLFKQTLILTWSLSLPSFPDCLNANLI